MTATMDKMSAAFLIPGDLNTLTGGYIYDRRLIETLSQSDTPLHHVALDASWPNPTPSALAEVADQLDRLPKQMPVILDGLVFGAMPTEILARQPRPVIAMLHHPLGLEAGLAPARARALLALEKDNLHHAAHVIVTSLHTRAVAMDDFAVPPERITVALPGFDRPDVVPGFLKAMPPLILSVGTICERKGHDILLAALEQVAHLPWRCVIAGTVLDTALYDTLQAQRDAAGLAARVEFAGEVPRHALHRLYAEAQVFALATRYEGYGMVLGEAQLNGLPIISCAVGAVPQTVPEGSATLTPPDDPKAFAEGLERLLTDQNERSRLAAESRRRAQMLPQWSDTAAIVEKVLKSVVSHGAHRL
jgi:glycosyltransferase involved in cell wall biosynthesis